MSVIRIGYLVSRYPAVSHTFILREVLELKQLGFEIHVASINRADRGANELTSSEQQEEALCFYVKKSARRRFVQDFCCVAAGAPAGLANAFLFAISVSGLDISKAAKNMFYLAEAILVAAWMRQSGLTHLHVHFATPAATVGLLVSKLVPVGLSITVHGPDEFYNVNEYLLAQKCLRSRFLFAISHYAASQLMRLMPAQEWSKLSVVPLGVDPSVFLPAPPRKEDGSFHLLCVGRLVPEKGQHILLEAIGHLLREGRDVKLVLVGDGAHRPALEAFARRNGIASAVTFTGSINQDKIRSLYAGADAFVLASFAEGVPVVLMEAMAMEIPCVASWVAGIPELIRDGADGLLVPPGCSSSLANCIARLMDDPELRLRVGQAGRQRVIEKYNLKSNVFALGNAFKRRLTPEHKDPGPLAAHQVGRAA